jgi:hypothetical protein
LPAGAFQFRNDLRANYFLGCGRPGRPAPERTNRDPVDSQVDG